MATTEAPTPDRRRRWWVVAAAGALAAVVLWQVWPGEPAGTGTGAPSATRPSDGPTVEPSETTTATAQPTDVPTDAPTDEASGEPLRPTAPPVDLTEQAEPTEQVRVRLALLEAVAGEATLPGEVSGPALRVSVEVTNDTAQALDLTTAVTNLYHGAEMTPAITLSKPGRVDLPATLAPGSTATGVYVFAVPTDDRAEVTVEFDLSVEATVLLFSGDASGAPNG